MRLIQFPLIIIASLLGFLSLAGLSGGYALLTDVSGDLLGLPDELIDSIPLINNYFIPGLFIFLVFGLIPIVVLYGLTSFNKNKKRDNNRSRHHWSWIWGGIISLILISSIVIQLLIIGYQHPIQLVFGLSGVILLVLLSMKTVRQVYELN